MSDRTYWLIEMQGPAWLMIQEMAGGKHHGYVWTGDVQEALRFYSERQAELVMMAVRQDHRDLFPTCLIREPRPTEHMWVTQSLADLPEQPFNYRHPSKYGTDVPRRCYLEELTPEERAIRDLVDTVERLGAHPLLTATVIQLMKAGEDLADWVDIGLRDKAIAALSPGNDLGLLGENPAAGDTEVRNQAEGEAAKITERFPYEVNYKRKDGSRGGGGYETLEEAESFFDRLCNDVTVETATFREFYADVGAWELRASYEAHPDTERTSDESQAEDPTIDAITAHIENQPGVSSQASSTDAEELPPAFSAAEIADAERDGALAAAAGMFRSDNPYVAMSSKWEGWLAGYASGHKPYCPTCLTACRFDIQGCAVCDHNYTVWSGLAPSTPEGAECPVASDAYVDVLLRDGGGEGGPAGEVDWHHSLFHNHPNDVVLYRLQSASPRYDEDGLLIRKPSSDAERTEVASEPRDTNEQTGIFQSQTEAALNDKDEPDPAPYAPINAEEPAGDAAVFARGPEREKELIAEAEAEERKAEAQKFNPFRLFRQKEPA